LAQVRAVAAECPDLEESMLDHYERAGEAIGCADLAAVLGAIASQLAMEEQQQAERAYEAAVKAELRELAREQERKQSEFELIVRAEMQRQEAARRQGEFEQAVNRAIRDQTAEAQRQGEALVRRSCPGYGWYLYEIDPVRVWLSHCERSSRSSNNYGGDLDCEDIGYEHDIDSSDDPNNLDGDGDGIACEGW